MSLQHNHIAVLRTRTDDFEADADRFQFGVSFTRNPVLAALPNAHHMVAFRPGAGRVLVTSFHQESGINPDMQRALELLIFEL